MVAHYSQGIVPQTVSLRGPREDHNLTDCGTNALLSLTLITDIRRRGWETSPFFCLNQDQGYRL